jgi:hypothetical protein
MVCSCSLQNMLRVIGRIIRERYELRARESSKEPYPFNIMKDPRLVLEYSLNLCCLDSQTCSISNFLSFFRYALVCNAGSESVQRSVREGLGQRVQKSDILSLAEEQTILASPCCSVDHPQGLNNRMRIFCLRIFLIRGQSELRSTSPNQFQLLQNTRGDEFLR